MNGSIGNVSGPAKPKNASLVEPGLEAPEAALAEVKVARKTLTAAVMKNVLCMERCIGFRAGKMALTLPFG